MTTEKYNIVLTGTDGGNWIFGTVGSCEFQAKVYLKPSEYGIDGGNVSKLWIKDVANYDTNV